jgi:putative redox protein
LGGCSAYDVVHVLEKGREAIEDVVVELDAERAQQDPKVFTRVHMHFIVKGRRLAAEKVKRAIALSVEKYCSASAMIAKTATISHDFEVADTAATGAGTH